MNWVGVEKPEAAAKLFSAGGTPVRAIVSGGKTVRLQLEHTWAEVYVPYESYRGVATGPGEAKKQWVPLDASWKQYDRKPAANLVAAGVVVPGEAPADGPSARVMLDESRTRMAALLSEQPTSAMRLLLGGDDVLTARLGLLPGSLPLAPVTVHGEFDSESTSRRWRVSVRLLASEDSVVLDLPSLQSRRITVEYGPASEVDMRLVESMDAAPAYLLSMTAVLLVDGEVRLVGEPLALGTPEQVSVVLYQPGCAPQSVRRSLLAGSTHSVHVETGSGGATSAKRLGLQLEDVTASVLASQVVDSESLTGRLLKANAVHYFGLCRFAERLAQRLEGVASVEQPSLAFSSADISASEVMGVVASLEHSGFSIDVQSRPVVCVGRNGDSLATAEYMMLAGMLGSAAESSLFESLYGLPSVSAASLLSAAADNGLSPLTITPEDPSRLADLGIRTDCGRGWMMSWKPLLFIVAVSTVVVLAKWRLTVWERRLQDRRTSDGPMAVVWSPFMSVALAGVFFVLPLLLLAGVAWSNRGMGIPGIVAWSGIGLLVSAAVFATYIWMWALPRDKELGGLASRIHDQTATPEERLEWEARERGLQSARALAWIAYGLAMVSGIGALMAEAAPPVQVCSAGAILGIQATIGAYAIVRIRASLAESV